MYQRWNLFPKNPSLISTDIIQQCYYLECFFVAFAPFFFSPHVSLSLQLTMSGLFLFKEAAWVHIRHESSGVEMEVYEGAIWQSPLVDFTAGPPALLHPQRQWSLWDSLKEKMEGKVLVIFAHIKKHLKSYLKCGIKQNELKKGLIFNLVWRMAEGKMLLSSRLTFRVNKWLCLGKMKELQKNLEMKPRQKISL